MKLKNICTSYCFVSFLPKAVLDFYPLLRNRFLYKTAKSQYILGQHNGKDVILRKGKFGLYISWGENSKTLKELGNRPIDNITFDEVRKYLDEGSNMIRDISANLSIRKGPKGDYIFYKTSKMKKPIQLDLM